MIYTINPKFKFSTNILSILRYCENRKVLRRICNQILAGTQTKDELGCLTEQLQCTLHYVLVNRIKHLRFHTKTVADRIFQYVEMLDRLHRGLFWRVFNYFDAYHSNSWYCMDRKHLHIILYSLACTAPRSTGHHQMQSYNLDNVFDWPINGRVLGMRKSDRHMEFSTINPAPAQAIWA